MSRIVMTDDRGNTVPVSTTKFKQNFRNTFITTRYMLQYVLKKKQAWVYTVIQIFLALYQVLPLIVYTVFPGLIITELMGAQRKDTVSLYLGVLILTPVF